MKNFLFILGFAVLLYSCGSTNTNSFPEGNDPYAQIDESINDTVKIANDSLEYEIMVIDPGYSFFLHAYAKPEGYYSLSYLENKNQFLVTDYNQRVRQPWRYPTEIYTQTINYDPFIDYGYEVNYKLYNYFLYLSHRYNQDFSVPTRI